jgi:hypothetical protein
MSEESEKSLLNDAIMREIKESVGSLRFGTITIKVHCGKVIQFEVTEKRRFDQGLRSSEGR